MPSAMITYIPIEGHSDHRMVNHSKLEPHSTSMSYLVIHCNLLDYLRLFIAGFSHTLRFDKAFCGKKKYFNWRKVLHSLDFHYNSCSPDIFNDVFSFLLPNTINIRSKLGKPACPVLLTRAHAF